MAFNPYFRLNLNQYSQTELDSLKEFRNRTEDIRKKNPQFDDGYLMRFLIARKFDVNKTMEMWTNFINWRNQNQVGEPFDYPEKFEAKKYFPHGFFQIDKVGRPVYIERIGCLNYNMLFKVTSEERFIKYYISKFEMLQNEIFPYCSEQEKRRIDKYLFIMDMTGMSWSTVSKGAIDLTRKLMVLGKDYYPEMVGEMYIVNTPGFFVYIWKMIEFLIDEKTKKKIHIVGTNYQDTLKNKVDEKNLPDFLGGTATECEYGPNLTYDKGPWDKFRNVEKNETRAECEVKIQNCTEIQDRFDPLEFFDI